MKKRILSCLMALALCLTQLPTAALAEEADPAALAEGTHSHPICGKTCTHGNEDGSDQRESVTWTGVDSLDQIKTAGNYYLTQNVELSNIWKPVTGVNLCLNGKKITGSQGQLCIEVTSQNALTLCDCVSNGSITHKDGDKGRGVLVSGGTFTMYGGSITGNTANDSGNGDGGGVCVRNGEFRMIGGSITGNTAPSGGGVYVGGQGTFTMSNSASITDNKTVSSGNGGGVYISGNFTMSGGEITGNTTHNTGDGGGVFVNHGGTFQMFDGSNITGNTGYRGGGVSVDRGYSAYNPGAFTMSSGNITNNNAQYGGGVYISGNFTMSGGEISSNQATGNSGGVHVNTDSTFTVSGAPKITGNTLKSGTTNNVCLSEGTTTKPDATITIGNVHLSTGASIGVTTKKTLTTGSSVTIATDAKSGDEKYFTSDADGDYHFVLDGDKVKLGQHQHNWTYALSTTTTANDTITATCNATGCPAPNGGSVTIKAPSALTYDGTPKAVTLDSTLDSSIQTPNIMYQQGDAVLNNNAPTDAGTYTASITLGEGGNAKTASVEYTIKKATPHVKSWMGYPRGWTFTENTPIADPTELTIANGTFRDITRFEWYNATKNADNYTEGAKLDGNPTDAGDYIIKAVFEESNNVFAAADAHGLTISKAQHANNGVNIEVPLTVYPASKECKYNVDIAEALKNIPHGGGLMPNTEYSGISINSSLVKSTKWDDGKLYVTMNPLANITGTTLGSITVNLTSKNYTVVPVVVNITLQPKQEVQNISVSMDNWTYGENAKTPQYTLMAGAEETVTYAVKGSGIFSETVPSNVGKYTVKVQYETVDHIYTGTADFTIYPKNISGVTINLGPQATYNGSEQDVVITSVDLDGTPLATTDYTITSGGTATNVGDTKLEITGKGNYTGTASETWSLNAKEVTLNWGNITDRKWKDGKTVTATVSNKVGNDEVNVTVTGGDQTAVGGPYTATAAGLTGAQAGNYKLPADKAQTYSIAQVAARDLPDITVSQKFNVITEQSRDIDRAGMPEDAGTLTYAKGSESKTGTVTIDSWSVDTTGKVTYKLSGGAANDTVTLPVTITSDNYADSTVNVKITLTDKDIPTVTANGIIVTYDGNAIPNSKITGTATFNGNTVEGAWGFKTTAPKFVADSSDSVAVVFTPKDTTTYAAVETKIKVTINKATPTGTPTYTAITTSGKTLTDAVLGIGSITPAGGTITWDAGNATVVAANTAYGWTYMPTDTANYNKLTGTITPYVVSSSGGGSRPSTNPVQTEVSKEPDGSVSLSKTNAAKGDKVTVTVKPDRHYEVDEVIVRDSKGKQLAVKDNGDGTFTFEMPADKVTVEPTFSWVNPFADVADSAYYVDAVEWMLKHEVTQGTTETTFSPNLNCTRAQIVTFLWRAAGSPEPKGTVGFADVSADSYYAKAVAWAIENGITGGTGDGLFSPDATCTRAQSAAFLYRAAGSPAVSGSAGFSDVAADAYYASAVAWAKEHGITDGIGGGLFGSANDCTRAQIAAFLYRYMK